MTDSSLPPTELSDFEEVGSADEDDGVGSTIDDATAKFEFCYSNFHQRCHTHIQALQFDFIYFDFAVKSQLTSVNR